jgi:hypothetical protein
VVLHTDIPTRLQVERLLQARDPASVSIYLPTDPASSGEAERIEFGNLAAEAVGQLRTAAARDRVAAIEEEFADLAEDEEFWRHQARSLALFVTPGSLRSFRLPNRLVSSEVARAATYGAVDTVLVDIDEVVPGSVDEQTGAVTFGEAGPDRYGVVDEIARRVWLTGGRVLAVRRDDIPGEGPVAAILRYAPAPS